MKILFINIGWMNWYDGPREDDPTRGNFGHLKSHSHGSECFTFKPYHGFVYGIAPGGKAPSIINLGGNPQQGYVEGILVVWMARSPIDKQTYIVGWYKNATVYSSWQDSLHNIRSVEGYEFQYLVKAKKEDAHRVEPDERVFSIPTSRSGKSGFGQSSFWYARNREDIKEEVLRYINKKTIPTRCSTKQNGPGRQLEHEKRMQIEKTAIEAAIDYYEEKNYSIQSVENEAKGWDLEARKASHELFIEVKGTSSTNISVEFTPNEFDKMNTYQNKYIIFVVTDCLKKPKNHIFKWNNNNIWIDEHRRHLKLKEKTGAVGYCE